MKYSKVGGTIATVAIILVIVVTAAVQVILSEQMPGAPPAPIAPETEPDTNALSAADFAAVTASLTARDTLSNDDKAADDALDTPKDQTRLQQANLEQDEVSVPDGSSGPEYPYALVPPKRSLAYLRFYVYSEVPIEKPADIVLDQMKDIPLGSPVEEIKRAADAFDMNFNFMKAVAKIESDFDPKQRTGSYIGLFQLSRYEFNKFGAGDILNPRDNAVAAAYKFIAEATMFEWWARKKPTMDDLYLIHQQGWQGAAEHVAHPERVAWKSMCATDEGKEKGEKWCKRAVWGNTLPSVKHIWKTVDNLTSGEFTTMWRQRLNMFYARYSEADASAK